MSRKIIVTLLAFVCFCCIAPVSAARQTDGLTVSPSFQKIELRNKSTEFAISYKNTTSSEITLQLKQVDIREYNGEFRFDDTSNSSNPYALAERIHIAESRFVLSPFETKIIYGTIDNADIGIGGHYASVIAEISSEDQSNAVQVRGAISSMLFARTMTGKEIEEADIQDVKYTSRLFQMPEKFSFKMFNKGNVDVVPNGVIEVQDASGRKIGSGVVNEYSFSAFPESSRVFDISLDQKSSFLIPGIYSYKIVVGYGLEEKKVTINNTFFCIGDGFFWGLVVSLLLIIVFVFYRKKHKKLRIL